MKASRRHLLKNTRAEAEAFRRRALLSFALVALALLLLAGWYFRLQVIQHDEFQTRSEANRIKPRPVVPARGLIYDRAGRLLADNVPAYRRGGGGGDGKDLDGTLAALRELLPIGDEELARFHAARRNTRSFRPVPLKLRLSEAEVARFAVNRHRFPGVDVVPYLTRRYPHAELFAHVVGYVGRMDTDDLARLGDAKLSAFTHVGKSGIERFHEDRLRGDLGYEEVEQNAQGRDIRVLDRIPARPGSDLFLTLDARLQEATVAAFQGQHGAAVVVDPRNGEVLSLVSLPAFDPNLFVNGIGEADYRTLVNAPARPLFNRAVLGGYEPGSTIKPFVAMAGLDLGVRTASDRVLSTGAFRLGAQEREYRDWKKGGHGWVDLRESLAQSVNTYYFQLAHDLGIDRMSEYLTRFGFGQPTAIDLTGEAVGILPSREWKRGASREPWYPGETVIAGIGQGYWVTTPLQLAQAISTLADGGERHRLHLLRAIQTGFGTEPVPVLQPEGERVVEHPEHLAAVRDGLVAVMHSPTGTARAAAVDASYLIAGKTGTAQRVTRRGNEEVDLDTLPFHLRHRALFVAYAPADDPRIAIALVVESGGSGSRAAAPIARRIFDAWLDREPSE